LEILFVRNLDLISASVLHSTIIVVVAIAVTAIAIVVGIVVVLLDAIAKCTI